MSDNERLRSAKNALWRAMHAVCRTKPHADEHNAPALAAMAYWLIDAPYPGLRPGKAVGLRGPVGTGKTDLMRALGRAMVMGGAKHAITTVNAIRIVKEFSRTKDENGRDVGGDAVILRYASCGPLCIDDMGREDPGKHYGKDANVIGDIIALRYERWREDPAKYLTCGTTNLTNEALRERYDERALSRLDEMQVFYPLGGPDRRATSSVEVHRGLFEIIEEAPAMSMEEHSKRCDALRKHVAETVAKAAEALKA